MNALHSARERKHRPDVLYPRSHAFGTEHITSVARWLGHSLSVLLRTYAHVIDEYSDSERVDAELEIGKARGQIRSPACVSGVRQTSILQNR
jgi:hypothetical protein